MIEMGKLYTTRDGRAVRILCTDAPGDCPPAPVVGLINGDQTAYHWQSNGQWASYPTDYDLVEFKEEKRGWINVYPRDMDHPTILATAQGVYASKRSADVCANPDRIACIAIEWEAPNRPLPSSKND